MTQVIADPFQGETAREQSPRTGMTQRVRPKWESAHPSRFRRGLTTL